MMQQFLQWILVQVPMYFQCITYLGVGLSPAVATGLSAANCFLPAGGFLLAGIAAATTVKPIPGTTRNVTAEVELGSDAAAVLVAAGKLVEVTVDVVDI